MELAGLEPATSWVRYRVRKPNRGDLSSLRCSKFSSVRSAALSLVPHVVPRSAHGGRAPAEGGPVTAYSRIPPRRSRSSSPRRRPPEELGSPPRTRMSSNLPRGSGSLVGWNPTPSALCCDAFARLTTRARCPSCATLRPDPISTGARSRSAPAGARRRACTG